MSCLRQRIPGITPGLLLRQSFPFLCLRLTPALKIDHFKEQKAGSFVPDTRFALALGSHCPPGFVGMNTDQREICRSLSCTILVKPLSLSKLVQHNDGSNVRSLSLSIAACRSSFS
jgi:hypothetical protein